MSGNNDNVENFENSDGPTAPPGGGGGGGGNAVGTNFNLNIPSNDLPQLLDSTG